MSTTDLKYDILSTEFGSLVLISSQRGLRFIHYYDTLSAARIDGWLCYTHAERDPQFMKDYIIPLLDYLRGETQSLELPLDLQGGTELQRRVWQELCKIPYGSTISYSDLAARVAEPQAIRAVASACGKNPLPLAIPCHRVFGKDGSLGGFAWGVDKKEQLLQIERINSGSSEAA